MNLTALTSDATGVGTSQAPAATTWATPGAIGSATPAPYDLGANFPFTVRDDVTFSYYQYSPYVTGTAGGTHATLCIRIN